MKKTIIFLFVGICMFLFTGCTTSLKDEDEILTDFANYEENLSFLNFNSMEISKRQTNKDDKEDIIYASIIGEGEFATHEYECKLVYNYYEQGGWILDAVEIQNCLVKELNTISDNEILSMVNDSPQNYLYGDYDSANFNIESREFSQDALACTTTLNFQISCNKKMGFDSEGQLFLYEFYDLETGQWRISDTSHNVWTQTLHNIENLEWRYAYSGFSEYTGHNLYEYIKLVQTDTLTFDIYQKRMSDSSGTLKDVWEYELKAEITIDFLDGDGTSVFYKNPDSTCDFYINWDTGTIYWGSDDNYEYEMVE